MTAVSAEPSFAFYEAAAQLIPLLFGIFIAERYVVARAGKKPFEQVISVVQVIALLAIFVSGEVVALNVLATEDESDWKRSFVTSAMATGTALIVIGFLREYASKLSVAAASAFDWIVGAVAVLSVILIAFVF